MIPFNRPFLGRDLDQFRIRLGLTAEEMCFMTGVSRNRWFLMVKQEKDLPVRDVPIALLCRLIDKFEDLNFMPQFISPGELFKNIEKDGLVDITKREFSLLMGNNSTSANRWTNGKKRATPQTHRLATVVSRMTSKMGHAKALAQLKEVVLTEAHNRNIADIFNDGTWVNEDIQSKRVVRTLYGKQKAAAEKKKEQAL